MHLLVICFCGGRSENLIFLLLSDMFSLLWVLGKRQSSGGAMQPGRPLMKLNVSNVPTDSAPLKQTAGRDRPPQQAHTCSGSTDNRPAVGFGGYHGYVLVTPGPDPLHLTPRVPDPDQLLRVPTVLHLQPITHQFTRHRHPRPSV